VRKKKERVSKRGSVKWLHNLFVTLFSDFSSRLFDMIFGLPLPLFVPQVEGTNTISRWPNVRIFIRIMFLSFSVSVCSTFSPISRTKISIGNISAPALLWRGKPWQTPSRPLQSNTGAKVCFLFFYFRSSSRSLSPPPPPPPPPLLSSHLSHTRTVTPIHTATYAPLCIFIYINIYIWAQLARLSLSRLSYTYIRPHAFCSNQKFMKTSTLSS